MSVAKRKGVDINIVTLAGARRWLVALLASLLLVLMVAGTAWAITISKTNNHDWTEGQHTGNGIPPCDDPLPCVGDLSGSSGSDILYASDGWDYLNAQAGADELHGGKGMDVFYGNEGDDSMYGDESHDHIWGDEGDDLIKTNDGEDEAGNIEEVFGTRVFQQGHDPNDSDTCVVDEDTNDGIVVNECENLRILDVPGMSGSSEIGTTKANLDAHDTVFLAPNPSPDPWYHESDYMNP